MQWQNERQTNNYGDHIALVFHSVIQIIIQNAFHVILSWFTRCTPPLYIYQILTLLQETF